MYEFEIGCDPEVFVKDEDKFVSAHGMVDGTKYQPHKVENGAVQVDGMALEFNTDPAKSKEQFQHNLNSVLTQLEGMIGDKKFLTQCSVFFTQEDIANVPEENLILGCEPDFNGYLMDINKRPDAATMMRTAGGHVHIGGFKVDDPYDEGHFDMSAAIARAMDREVGVYSLMWDEDDQRRSMYGQAGAFRPKKYGMEYRTLSNAWIFSKDIIDFVYDGTKRAVESVLNGDVVEDTTFRDIINNSNRSHAFFQGNKTAELVKDMIHA